MCWELGRMMSWGYDENILEKMERFHISAWAEVGWSDYSILHAACNMLQICSYWFLWQHFQPHSHLHLSTNNDTSKNGIWSTYLTRYHQWHRGVTPAELHCCWHSSNMSVRKMRMRNVKMRLEEIVSVPLYSFLTLNGLIVANAVTIPYLSILYETRFWSCESFELKCFRIFVIVSRQILRRNWQYWTLLKWSVNLFFANFWIY